MGNFVIQIEAVGGHGCERWIGANGLVYGCNRMNCPDCETRRFVKRLQQSGTVVSAKIIHWPVSNSTKMPDVTTGTITDDLITHVRDKDFPEKKDYDSGARTRTN